LTRDKKITIADTKLEKNPLVWAARISTTHPGKVLLAFAIITFIFLIPTSQLTIDSSIEGMFGSGEMPEEIEKFQDVSDLFGEQELVTIVVDCSDSNSTVAKSYIQNLAAELNRGTDFTDIQYNQNMNFGGNKTILYLPEEYLYFVLDPNATAESVNGTYQYIMSQFSEPSYFVSENGKIYLLNMVLNGSIESADQRMEIFDGLYDTLDDVQDSDPEYSDLEIGFTGSLVVMDYEGDKMAMNDMIVTLFITFILILILLFISFRSISIPAMALVPLFCGIIITAGITILIYGAMSMVAAFFAVLLLGLGIDFSIHLLTRFMEDIEEFKDVNKAFENTSRNTGKAIVLGTLTTATAFGALLFSKTGGMHQMGAILAIGLIVTVICVFFILPALVTIRLRYGKLKQKLEKQAKYEVLATVGSSAKKYAAVFIVILLVFGALIVYESQDIKINENLAELMPTTVPSYKQLEKVKDNFNYTEDYLICVVDSYAELETTVEGFRAIPEVMEVESVLDLLPQNQSAKLSIFAQARLQNPALSDIGWLNIQEMTYRDLPENIRRNWVHEHSNGTESYLIRVKAWGNIWDDEYRENLLNEMHEINPVVVGRAVAMPELIVLITEDVINVSIFAAIPIIIIVYIGFRKRTPAYALLATVPVLFGVGSVIAFSDYLGIDLNMISIMMIPLVIGIGIDDGIHILHRYKEEGKGSIPKAVQTTGKAIFLTTATTCLAFSSFLVAEHPGMRPMGGVPVMGLILAFIAAILFLPALMAVILDRNGKKGWRVEGLPP
jgi:predicted RND superfamily exporter protein